MLWLLQPILSFLGGPVVRGAVEAYKVKQDAQNNSERIAADLAGRELLVEQRELELTQQLKVAQIGHWYEPEHLFGYTMVIYFAKCIVWDKVFAAGSTDPIAGDLLTWAGWIMAFYVGSRGVVSIARILKS